jgi:hypothetical protein
MEQNCSLKLFDGQHKAIASWLNAQDSVVCKIYFNMAVLRTNTLVNSIQSIIKKLPLSSLELSAKMSEEFKGLFTDYALKLPGGQQPSESGFFQSLPKNDQKRAKKAFRTGLVEALRDVEAPTVFSFTRKGVTKESYKTITETSLITKLLAQLIVSKPLDETNYAEKRDREQKNITRMLNHLTDICFSADYFDAHHPDPSNKERQERMSHQGSLSQIGYLLNEIFARNSPLGANAQPLLNYDPDTERWAVIEKCIDKLANHPLWTYPFRTTENMATLENSMQKNQHVRESFRDVNLDFDYLTGDGPPVANWQGPTVPQ